MGPNDLIFFFPVKLELKPDLAVEISTGNTSEISAELRSKSGILVDFGAKFPDLTPKFVAGRNFYGSQIFENEKYGASASFYTNPKTRKSRTRQSW